MYVTDYRTFSGFQPRFILVDVLVFFLLHVFSLGLQFGKPLFRRMIGMVWWLLVLLVEFQLLLAKHSVSPSALIYSFFMNVGGGWVCICAYLVLAGLLAVFLLDSSFVSVGDGISG
jgi:hypothetical protein